MVYFFSQRNQRSVFNFAAEASVSNCNEDDLVIFFIELWAL